MKYILRRVVQSEAFLQKRNLLQKNVIQQNPNHFTLQTVYKPSALQGDW